MKKVFWREVHPCNTIDGQVPSGERCFLEAENYHSLNLCLCVSHCPDPQELLPAIENVGILSSRLVCQMDHPLPN